MHDNYFLKVIICNLYLELGFCTVNSTKKTNGTALDGRHVSRQTSKNSTTEWCSNHQELIQLFVMQSMHGRRSKPISFFLFYNEWCPHQGYPWLYLNLIPNPTSPGFVWWRFFLQSYQTIKSCQIKLQLHHYLRCFWNNSSYQTSRDKHLIKLA